MKKLLLLTLFTTPLFAAEPFGVKMGDPITKFEKSANDPRFFKVPKPHPSFIDYGMVSTPETGVCKVIGMSKMIDTSRYGEGIKDFYQSTKEALATNYTLDDEFDYLKPGSIWDDSKDYTMSLLKQERTLAVMFNDKSDGTVIMLRGYANKINKGYFLLSYEFKNADRCFEILKNQKNSSL